MRGVKARDTRIEAEAFLVLAQAYVLDSRIQLAHRLSSRARELFLRDSNIAGQADALAMVSYTASALGMNVQAVKAATEGVALRERMESSRVHSVGYNYLGVASFWANDFKTASESLGSAIRLASHRSDGGAASFHPWVNLCLSEVLQIVQLERAGRPADLTRLRELVLQGRAMAKEGQTATLRPGICCDGALILFDFSSCFSASRAGHLEEAYEHFVACRDRTFRMPQASWLQALVWWARLELAKAHGNVELSIRSAHAMAVFARRGEHAQMQALASALEADVMTLSWT